MDTIHSPTAPCILCAMPSAQSGLGKAKQPLKFLLCSFALSRDDDITSAFKLIRSLLGTCVLVHACDALKPHACVSCHVAVSAMRPEHMLYAAWQQAVRTEVATFLSFSACTRARIQCVPGRPRPNGTDYLTANLPASKMKHVYTRTLRHTKSASDFSKPSDARKATRRAEHVRMMLSLSPSCVRACLLMMERR